MRLDLVALILSIAALIGVAYNQNLYCEALKKRAELEKAASISKNESRNIQPLVTDDLIHKEISGSRMHTTAEKTQHNPDPERFYAMFKNAINRYEKEMREKYSRDSKEYNKSRLNKYKKRLDINDMQWQFVESIFTDYLEKLDQLRKEVFRESKDDGDDHWQRLLDEQQRLKDEYAKKLTPYLTNQQIDDFKEILIQ